MAREKVICWTEQDGQMISVARLENNMVEIRLVNVTSHKTTSTATLLPHRWDYIVKSMQQKSVIEPTHPSALHDRSGGFRDGNDCLVVAGDRVEYRFDNHRRGVLEEALQDGDAFVNWDEGTHGSHGAVKWCNLAKIN